MNVSEAMHAIVARHARDKPAAIAVVLGDMRMTYAELHERVSVLSRALVAAGLGRGERVAMLQTPHPDALIALLATTAVGGVWVGLNPRYRHEEIAHVVRDCEPRILITRTEIDGRDYRDDLAALRDAHPDLLVAVVDGDPALQGAPFVRELVADSPDPGLDDAYRSLVAGYEPRAPFMIVYTSGSTGRPKGAVLHGGGIVDFAKAQNALWPLKPHRLVNYLPINHVACFVDLTFPALEAGGTVVFLEHFDSGATLALMAREGITYWAGVPSAFQMQCEHPDFDRTDLSCVQLVFWGGAPMPLDLVVRLQALGMRMVTNYGMTESVAAITAIAPTTDVEQLAESVGTPFPGSELRLVDAEGRDVASGDAGEIWVRSPYLFLGYWGQEDATAKALTEDGYLRTGDLGIQRPDGQLKLVGRLGEMFKSGGYNVYPREIEIALEAHPAVTAAAVVSVPDPRWQEVGTAFVSVERSVAPDELTAWCRERLANYKIPKRIVVEDALPLLPLGKIDKPALRQLAMDMLEK